MWLCHIFIAERTTPSLFGENGSIQRALMVLASAATTAAFPQARAGFGAVFSWGSEVQPSSWLAQASVAGLQHYTSFFITPNFSTCASYRALN